MIVPDTAWAHLFIWTDLHIKPRMHFRRLWTALTTCPVIFSQIFAERPQPGTWSSSSRCQATEELEMQPEVGITSSPAASLAQRCWFFWGVRSAAMTMQPQTGSGQLWHRCSLYDPQPHLHHHHGPGGTTGNCSRGWSGQSKWTQQLCSPLNQLSAGFLKHPHHRLCEQLKLEGGKKTKINKSLFAKR